MKSEIIDYLLCFSKGLIEDDTALAQAYDEGKVTRMEIHDFIDDCADLLHKNFAQDHVQHPNCTFSDR